MRKAKPPTRDPAMVEFGKMLRRHVAAMKRIVGMTRSYTGLFLIGDKAANRVTHVQVINSDGNSVATCNA